MISKLEYWFLDVALQMPIGINSIVPDRQGFLDVNRKPLNISFVEMAEVLDKLFKQGYLSASKPYSTVLESTPDKIANFIPSKDEILQGLQIGSTPEIIEDGGNQVIERYSNLFDFFLTFEGGSLWESVSYPQWDKYFLHFTDYERKETTIECYDRNIGEKILKLEHLLDLGSCHIEPTLGTEKWELIIPWHPVYWKIIPSGYKLSYSFEYNGFDDNLGDSNKSTESINRKDEVVSWYENICNNWYTNFFKTQD